MACRAICNAHTRQCVCDHKQFSFRICCMAPPSPNQHIGGRSSAHRMCVGRDDLASSFAIDVPFETDFSVSVYVYACVLTQLTGKRHVVLDQLAR